MEDEEEQFINAIRQFLDAMGSPRVIHGGRGGLNSRTNLAYAFYLLTAAFYYPRFRLLPTDGGHKRELASYVARILQFRLGYTFELKNGEHVEWDHPFVIDKVGKRIQGQDAIAFSYDRLYSVGVPDRLADGVRRVIQQFELPVNLEVSGGLLFATIVAQSGFGQGDVIARGPLDDPLPQAVNHDSGENDDSEEEGEEDDGDWFDMLR